MKKFALTVVLLLPVCLISGLATASDYIKERRWASQVTDSLMVGEAVTLQAGAIEFLGIYTPASSKIQRGGVILLHGLGAHPDWPDVINPLRQELPEKGWATLSLQLPIRSSDARFEEYLPLFPAANERISAAIEYFRQQGLLNITLVGHSLGAAMGAYFLAEAAPGSEQVRAFVGIGMGKNPGTVAHTPDMLAKITLPVLDLYGSQDLFGVLDSATARQTAARRAGNPAYRQQKVIGANHFFRGMDGLLVKQVSSWLTRYAPSAQLPTAQVSPRKP